MKNIHVNLLILNGKTLLVKLNRINESRGMNLRENDKF